MQQQRQTASNSQYLLFILHCIYYAKKNYYFQRLEAGKIRLQIMPRQNCLANYCTRELTLRLSDQNKSRTERDDLKGIFSSVLQLRENPAYEVILLKGFEFPTQVAIT
jgi:hypothetical protein